MKKSKFLIFTLVATILAGVSLTSCQESETIGAPQIGLKFKTINSPISLSGLRTAQEKELSFTSGFITLREVEFEVETDEDSIEIEFNIEINTKVDFATGETNPDISFVEIPAGTYNEMEVEIELQDEGDSPAMVLYGTYVDKEGTSHPVRFEFNSGETFEVEKEGRITFTTSESVLAQVTFDPTAWFAGVSDELLSSAIKDNEGTIVISETQNSEIFDIVADGLDLATEVELVVF